MEQQQDQLANVETQRLKLEDNLTQLRKNLQHWQIWDADYEALKEELADLPTESDVDLEHVREAFDGELLGAKEVGEIFGGQRQRSRDQIINVLDHRIDYVGENIRSLKKRLDAAEASLADLGDADTLSAENDEAQLTEIVEELDDDDNVLSYHLNTPSSSLPRVQGALEEAGIRDVPDLVAKQIAAPSKSERSNSPSPSDTSKVSNIPRDSQNAKDPPVAPSEKKGVSFSEDTKPGDDVPRMSRNAQRLGQIMDNAKQQESFLSQNPVIPQDEDPEDAALRQEMLKYSMGEVGAVVAELQLEEIGSDEEDYEFEYSDLEEEEDDDVDDNHGRYQGRVITDDYRERMLELEKKLGVRSRFTEAAERRAAEAGDSSDDEKPSGEGLGRIKISHTPAADTNPVQSIVKKASDGASDKPKAVRFAESLDIAPEDDTETAAAPSLQGERPPVDPMSDIVVERSSGSAAPPKHTEPRKAGKVSRFKQSRGQDTKASGIPKGPFDVPSDFVEPEPLPEPPTHADGVTIADTLVERETKSRPVAPDEFDESMIHDEVADEYQRMRKKFIQREGGFLKEEEAPIERLDDANGATKPMSRFKAARLSRQ